MLKYNYETNALSDVSAPITELKIPLTEADTATTSINLKEFALDTPLSVTAGNLVATAFTFKPGKAYTIGENASDSENVLSSVSWYEDPGALQYLGDTDNNISSFITDSIRYNYPNGGVYNGFFEPSFPFSYNYVSYLIYYHVNYNQTATGFQGVNSLVASQSIYPNPSSDQAVLRYTLKTSALVIITISDITGKIIRSVNEGNVDVGLNQQLINAQVLPDGVYLVSIIANGNTSVSKLVVAR